jgi:hypothetical protein
MDEKIINAEVAEDAEEILKKMQLLCVPCVSNFPYSITNPPLNSASL